MLLNIKKKKKKKCARTKVSKITLVVLHDFKDSVPRGTIKDKLIEEGRMINKQMGPGRVRALFSNALIGLNIKAYSLLDVVGHKITVAENQDPDGDKVVENTSKRKGSMLYLIEADKVC